MEQSRLSELNVARLGGQMADNSLNVQQEITGVSSRGCVRPASRPQCGHLAIHEVGAVRMDARKAGALLQ